jgi:CheY-specific phosphatase CheX
MSDNKQVKGYCIENADGELLIHTVGTTEGQTIDQFGDNLAIYTVTQMIQEKGYKIVPVKITKV